MKKALAILLVAVMALGMGVVTFADIGDPGVKNSSSPFTKSSGYSVVAGEDLELKLNTDIIRISTNEADTQWVNATAANMVEYGLSADDVGFEPEVSGSTSSIAKFADDAEGTLTYKSGAWYVTIPTAATGNFTIEVSITDDTRTASGTVSGKVVDEDDSSSSDDDSSTSTGTTAGVAKISSGAKIDDFNSSMSLYYGYKNVKSTGRDIAIDLDKVRPSDEQKEKIWLYTNMFDWKDGTVTTHGYLNSSMVRTSKLAVRTKIAAGSKAVDSVTIAYDSSKAYIKVKFVTEWVNTGDLDFDFTVYLVIDGKRKDSDGEGLTFTGNLENNHISIYANDDYVDLSLGEVAEAEEFVSKIEVDLGNGVSIWTKFFKGKEYYGTATRDADEAADVVFAKYPDVDNVVILKTVGLNSSSDYVVLDTDFYDYYVYDKDLNYLGQASAELKYSSRYYLANTKLNVEDDYEGPEDEDYEYPAETGGEYAASNANANPGTGC